MPAPAYVPTPPAVLSKPVAEPSADTTGPVDPWDTWDPWDEDPCVFSAEGPCTELPLTSEPPLPDAEPLTSEPPIADTAPLTSESDGSPDPSGLDAFPAQYRPEP
ncbi:hypothetical protein G3I20_12275 [Streptomyces sp. SID8111]|uniref:hypothetical protein n=1 Tax=Streptomyces sp. SID8111 TaxID=2706100 RepID=UPI0013C04015|nr:hypothetical protein [Streptomyces sp. SID8111]